ncbi:bolA-like protein 2 [Ctenocephalides felis]|uniref:bolA-like protein 2 n=1 Tax=Ctenocephalides felis TaxID=7515 RepID=UPI000E6E1D54|nr:bolA-like protein 2 [Ctenocephalides felis]
MSYTKQYLEEKLKTQLQAEHVEVVDLSDGCGDKFSAVIVSSVFEGKPLLARHKLVNSTLAEELKTIHAFSQKPLTPEQWKAQQ